MLYGAINVSPQRAPEYFKEATAGLKQMQLLKEAEKKQEEATEKKARAAMLDPSEVNFASTWDSTGGAAQDAAQQLRDMKDELMKTEEGRAQYNTYLNELTQFIELAEEDYKQTYSVFINNTNVLRAGNEYENRMQDAHDLAFYEDQAKIDDNRGRYKVRFEGGHMVLDDGSGPMRFNDPRIFNTQRYDAKLERMDPVNPDTFYRQSAYQPYIETSAQAKQAIKDALTTRRSRLDAIEWWLRNEPDGKELREKDPNMTADLILDVTENSGYLGSAMEAYEAAALKGWQSMTKGKKDKKDKKDEKKKTRYDLSDYNDSFEEEVVSKMQDLTVETYPEGSMQDVMGILTAKPESQAVGRKVLLEKPIDLGPYKMSEIAFDGRTEDITISLMDEYDNPISIVLDKDNVFKLASKTFNSQGEPVDKEGNVIYFPTDPSKNEAEYNPVDYFDAKYGEGSFSALKSILAQESAISKGSDVEDLLDGFNE